MPFKSEKQRRFLWAAHPEIAKRWAHEYPESNKGLPMYADQKKDDEKKAALEVLAEVINKSRAISILDNAGFPGQNTKAALDKVIRVDLPQAEGPTYAGQEREQGGADESKNVFDTVNAEDSDQACATDMLRKISVVLSKKLREKMELEEALEQLREPRYVPENLGVRRYSVPNPGVMHPAALQLAMQQQEEQSKKKPQQSGPVGGGSNPQFNPINAFGAISSSGNINGNAAFGQKNSPDSSKIAADNNPARWHNASEKTAVFPKMLMKALGTALSSGVKKAPAVKPVFKMPATPTHQDLMAYGKQIGYGSKTPTYTHQEFANYQLMKQRMAAQAANQATKATTSAPVVTRAAAPAVRPTPVASRPATPVARPRLAPPAVPPAAPSAGPVARPRLTPVAPAPQRPVAAPSVSPRPTTASPARPKGLLDDELSLDADIYNSPAAFGKSSASSIDELDVASWPAWQRSLLGAGMGAGYGLRAGALAGGALGGLHGALTEPGEYVDDKGQKQKHTRLQHVLRSLFTGVGMGGVAGLGVGGVAGGVAPYLPEKLGAETPAWQRAAGKNEEGGLNEKGRKSYEREHGGDLKAPVTESNPSGERAKRQNSFCARMCGMKRVNTGAETKADPDSRINKSLRKWNCKCSSAAQFGAKLAEVSAEDIQPDTAALLALALAGGGVGLQRGLHKKLQRGPEPVLVHSHVRLKHKTPSPYRSR